MQRNRQVGGFLTTMRAEIEHARWQGLSDEIFASPEAKSRRWKKIDVARKIRKELGLKQKADYIARKIRKP